MDEEDMFRYGFECHGRRGRRRDFLPRGVYTAFGTGGLDQFRNDNTKDLSYAYTNISDATFAN